MPRQKKERCCGLELTETIFKPRGIELPNLEAVNIELDELEAIYLCDYQDHDQSQAAELMGVSRGTVQRLLYSGRKKLIDFIINAKSLMITTGDHIVPPSCPEERRGRRRGGRGRGMGNHRRDEM
ncbi:MAG: DUF134 domain-containing protein [Cyanobacteriota bacterium]